jgi:hypothetical protein
LGPVELLGLVEMGQRLLLVGPLDPREFQVEVAEIHLLIL